MRLPLPQFDRSDRHPNHIAEVIATSTTEFLAQCLEPEDLSFPPMPPFGSWVSCTDEESGNQIYGIVYYVTTMPIDSVHRPVALGLSLQDLREEQPQIFAMLKTEFRAAIVGYKPSSEIAVKDDFVYQYLPPRPPQIHQAVYRCEPEDIIKFTEELDFLRTLLMVNGAPVDSLTAAAIREVYRLRKADRQWLVNAGRTLSVLLKDDYDRLRFILSQIHP
ncbi:MAG: HAS-barrel domain-containing protein [Mastigocoleus sp. MO_167.B18]|uniref:HAS-barrel domain-containing protein n=1 Tax=Mastigocoleus sp. MO_188.B34 TaxID=3036635 RepID=UPI0026090610|nr:HAS-barrel domain-containing protein [Mastigocoleus sp. MO_188.B34]MDJ0697843.1 HAS-barrel domain-containing protein [Mastigocoleus sp. MO_188.B34]MDJ0772996.1 HAS-barrel domain-containing protein [Mastigocoleus sp. MO_167.B18]